MPATIPRQDIDNILQSVIPHIQNHTQLQRRLEQKRPFILGLTGLQGSGKSTWTAALAKAIHQKHNYNTINISIDDLYLDHDELVGLRMSNPSNKLLRTRGQPGTHDTSLAVAFFQSLTDPSIEISIPSFNKSNFHGEGGRAPRAAWKCIPAGTPIDVVIFEGWCLGFQQLAEEEIKKRWSSSKILASVSTFPTETIQDHALEHLLEINDNLRRYCELFTGPQHFDFLVHLDTNDLVNVYEWRMQQEHALRQRGNGGMSDDEVVRFVKGYMPAYELYLDQLRSGLFKNDPDNRQKKQLRVVLDKERRIMGITTI